MRQGVYLLCFNRPISPDHTCKHYLGWGQDVYKRIQEHIDGTGSNLCRVAKERGIGFSIVKIWWGETRTFESNIKKKNKNIPTRLCPVCMKKRKAT